MEESSLNITTFPLSISEHTLGLHSGFIPLGMYYREDGLVDFVILQDKKERLIGVTVNMVNASNNPPRRYKYYFLIKSHLLPKAIIAYLS